MGTFSGEVRVRTDVDRLTDQVSPPASHNAQPSHSIGPGRDDVRRDGQQLAHLGHQFRPGEVDGADRADGLSAVLSEPLDISHAEQACQDGVVTHLRMHVQRHVGGVQREVVLHQGANPPAVAVRDRLEAAPEQPMMYQQEISAPRDGLVDRCLARVHCQADVVHLATVFHLQPVQGVRVVAHLGNSQVPVEVCGQFTELHQGLGPSAGSGWAERAYSVATASSQRPDDRLRNLECRLRRRRSSGNLTGGCRTAADQTAQPYRSVAPPYWRGAVAAGSRTCA